MVLASVVSCSVEPNFLIGLPESVVAVEVTVFDVNVLGVASDDELPAPDSQEIPFSYLVLYPVNGLFLSDEISFQLV